MAKKKRNSSKRIEKKASEKPRKISQPDTDSTQDSGGFPEVDFKKNLGCG
jgi:hypothetical protein